MRSIYLSALITGFLLAGGLTDTNPIQTATAGAYLTRTIGNDALGVNPASLGYYGKPIIFGAAEDGKLDTLGLMEKDTVSASEDSIQNYYSVQLIANPSKKRVKETKITFYGQFGNNIPWAVTKIDTLYKLRVGDFHNRDTVDAFLDTVIGSGFKDAWIVTRNRPLEEPDQIPYFTLTLAGAGLYAGNNAIYPDWINNQLFGGLDLRDPGKKNDFLSVFPADNWNINMAAEINFMSFTLGNFGLSIVQPEVLGSGNLPPAIMDVLFEGVKFEQPKDLSALHMSLLAASPISVDYGRQLQLPQLKNIVDRFYAGAGLNLLVGIADMHVDADRLEIITTPDSVLIEGKTTILT
ncbi:MAG: SPOR domain-containing protein, partial [Candidatus Marinimicrobia bacterium]|nr:SPOR domain-containing protein [Candidatus Neomarinimicrobiota bacterium]